MRQGEDLKGCVEFLNEGSIDDAQPVLAVFRREKDREG